MRRNGVNPSPASLTTFGHAPAPQSPCSERAKQALLEITLCRSDQVPENSLFFRRVPQPWLSGSASPAWDSVCRQKVIDGRVRAFHLELVCGRTLPGVVRKPGLQAAPPACSLRAASRAARVPCVWVRKGKIFQISWLRRARQGFDLTLCTVTGASACSGSQHRAEAGI